MHRCVTLRGFIDIWHLNLPFISHASTLRLILAAVILILPSLFPLKGKRSFLDQPFSRAVCAALPGLPWKGETNGTVALQKGTGGGLDSLKQRGFHWQLATCQFSGSFQHFIGLFRVLFQMRKTQTPCRDEFITVQKSCSSPFTVTVWVQLCE